MKELVSYRNRLEVHRLSLTPVKQRNMNTKPKLSDLLQKSEIKSRRRNLSLVSEETLYWSAQKVTDFYKEAKSKKETPGISIQEHISDGPDANSIESPSIPSIEFKDIAVKDAEKLLKDCQDSNRKGQEEPQAIETVK